MYMHPLRSRVARTPSERGISRERSQGPLSLSRIGASQLLRATIRKEIAQITRKRFQQSSSIGHETTALSRIRHIVQLPTHCHAIDHRTRAWITDENNPSTKSMRLFGKTKRVKMTLKPVTTHRLLCEPFSVHPATRTSEDFLPDLQSASPDANEAG